MRDTENSWKRDSLWYINKIPFWCGLQYQLCLSGIIRRTGLTAQNYTAFSYLKLVVDSVFDVSELQNTWNNWSPHFHVLLTLRDKIMFGPSGGWRLHRNLHATRALQMLLSIWIPKTSKNANFLDQPTRLGKQSSLHLFLSLLAQFHVWIVHAI